MRALFFANIAHFYSYSRKKDVPCCKDILAVCPNRDAESPTVNILHRGGSGQLFMWTASASASADSLFIPTFMGHGPDRPWLPHQKGASGLGPRAKHYDEVSRFGKLGGSWLTERWARKGPWPSEALGDPPLLCKFPSSDQQEVLRWST